MKIGSFLIIVFLFSSSCSKIETKEQNVERVQQVLAQQEDAWNEADIPAFMEGYWKSEDLRFISSGNMKMGWQSTIDRYYENYPNKEAMGKLNFDIIDTYVISNEAIGLSGAYHLTRNIGNLDGYFHLVFKKINNEWRIISDMTCAN